MRPSLLLLDSWLAADGEESGGSVRHHTRDNNACSERADLPHGHPDYAVVSAVRAGDRAAFEHLVLTHAPELVRLAYSIIGHMPDAEDAAQDVFLWLWENRTRWTPRAGVRPYLLRAVANRARTMRATHANRSRLEREHIAPFTDTATVVQHFGDTDAALWDAIRALPDRWREAVMLRYVEGCAFADVGAVLGVSEDAAKKVVRRALLALRTTLGERDG